MPTTGSIVLAPLSDEALYNEQVRLPKRLTLALALALALA